MMNILKMLRNIANYYDFAEANVISQWYLYFWNLIYWIGFYTLAVFEADKNGEGRNKHKKTRKIKKLIIWKIK